MLEMRHKMLLTIALILIITIPVLTWHYIMPLPTCNTPSTPGALLLYEGPALRVCRTKSEAIIENIWESELAIRVSWDQKDPAGTGDCPEFLEECFINNSVKPGELVRASIKNHSSIQFWAWVGGENALIDSGNFLIAAQ